MPNVAYPSSNWLVLVFHFPNRPEQMPLTFHKITKWTTHPITWRGYIRKRNRIWLKLEFGNRTNFFFFFRVQNMKWQSGNFIGKQGQFLSIPKKGVETIFARTKNARVGGREGPRSVNNKSRKSEGRPIRFSYIFLHLAPRDWERGKQNPSPSHFSLALLHFLSLSVSFPFPLSLSPPSMAISDKSSRQSLIPSFLYSSSSGRTLALEKILHAASSSSSPAVSNAETVLPRKSFVIAAPSEPSKKIELYSPAYYAACTAGGILSCGLTHMAVTPLDLVKCNMQVPLLQICFFFYFPCFHCLLCFDYIFAVWFLTDWICA